jgi:hypothetical protein
MLLCGSTTTTSFTIDTFLTTENTDFVVSAVNTKGEGLPSSTVRVVRAITWFVVP